MPKRKLYVELFLLFFRIGAFTFGGGYAMIPLIEREIVEKKKWIHEEDIVDLLAIAQMIPGAIAINTASLVGYKIAGKRGSIYSTLGVILPSFLIILLIASFFGQIDDSEVVKAIFTGINGAVIALIATAANKMAKASVKDLFTALIVIASVAVLTLTNISPFILIVLSMIPGIIIFKYLPKKAATLLGGDQ